MVQTVSKAQGYDAAMSRALVRHLPFEPDYRLGLQQAAHEVGIPFREMERFIAWAEAELGVGGLDAQLQAPHS